jgi:thioredoxin-related protein
MKKQVLLTFVFVIVVISSFMGYLSYRKIKIKEAFAEQIQELPEPDLFQWVGVPAPKNDKSTVVLFFHPDCEHCQYEARSIVAQKNDFANINLWWISAADSLAISKFEETNGLSRLQNTYLAHISGEKVLQTFGSISVPHIFIYDEDGILQKEFKGETKIDAILKYIDTQN